VVFPQPDGPTSAVNEPAGSDAVMGDSAATAPKSRETAVNSTEQALVDTVVIGGAYLTLHAP
jgi:hypothetical protein